MILTCKSIIKFGYRGERLIEPSSSWFPPKFPSGLAAIDQFYQVKRMIRGSGGVMPSGLFSNFKWVRTQGCLIEPWRRMKDC